MRDGNEPRTVPCSSWTATANRCLVRATGARWDRTRRRGRLRCDCCGQDRGAGQHGPSIDRCGIRRCGFDVSHEKRPRAEVRGPVAFRGALCNGEHFPAQNAPSLAQVRAPAERLPARRADTTERRRGCLPRSNGPKSDSGQSQSFRD